MPSPIAHTTVGYIVYSLFRSRSGQSRQHSRVLLSTSTLFSLLPDADSIAGLLSGEFGRYHNNRTHSIPVGLLASLGFSSVVRRLWKVGFRDSFLISFICYILHLVMDSATIGRGVMAWWPLSGDRFLLPVRLFYGFHWSDGWISQRHWWTLITEMIFAIPLVLLTRMIRQRSSFK